MVAIDYLKDVVKLRDEVNRLLSKHGQLYDKNDVPIALHLYAIKGELQNAIEELTAKVKG